MTGRAHEQQDGPLEGHLRQGKLYTPKLLTIPNFVRGDWVRDTLPDLLWPIAVLHMHGDDGLRRFSRFQSEICERARVEGADLDRVVVDGRLTSLEGTAPSAREQLKGDLVAGLKRHDLLPPALHTVLGLYDEIPGGWLLLDGSANTPSIDEHEALSFFMHAILAGIEDVKAATLAVGISWRVHRRTFSAGPEIVDLLRNYPDDPSTRQAADSAIRAAEAAHMLAVESNDPELKAARSTWAARFWRANGDLTICFTLDDITRTKPDESPNRDVAGTFDDAPEVARSAVAKVARMHSEFVRRSVDGDASADLFDPQRHEVITGLVARAARATISTLRTPHTWSSEHAASLLRLLAETRIVLEWLDLQDPSIYAEYQAYGRGKYKLIRRHMSALVEQFPDGAPSFLTEALSKVEEDLGGEWGEQFIAVNVDASFAGKTMRTMARETDLEDVYRFDYQIASGVTHGEWWSIESDAMVRCVNPMHRFHLIPAAEPEFPSSTMLAGRFLQAIEELMGTALAQLIRPH